MTALRRDRRWALPVVALVLALVGSGAWLGWRQATGLFLERAALQAESRLRLTVAGLRGELARFRPLPALIADDVEVKRLLLHPSSQVQKHRIDRRLKQIAADVEALDIYVMDATGLTLAASNFDQAATFIGNAFGYRPYFQQALAGGLGRYFALGTTSLKRGYYFASPVGFGGRVIGVVAVKVGVEAIETAWRGADGETLVTDEHGIVFMSSRPDWLYAATAPLGPEAQAELTASRRYADAEIGSLAIAESAPAPGGRALVSLGSGQEAAESLVVSTAMHDAGWTVRVFAAAAPARAQALTLVAAAVSLALILLLLAAVALQRRARLIERIATQREAQAELERRVEARTAELAQANLQLVQEVGERKATEQALRKTQGELVQAGKLAALGQMSAALSHEINQPLAAVKSYADNAGVLLERGRADEARDNVARISELADRMAQIGRHLRNFARKPKVALGPVALAAVVQDAAEVLAGRLRSTGAELRLELPSEEVWVKGGHVRLQQVLVNLLVNALDAQEHRPAPVIRLTADADAGRVTIRVRDFGPGIDPGAAPQIFDPFFSTKGIGKGLGLGLSISFNIVKDFGGRLQAANHPEGGAVFTVELERMPAMLGAVAE